MSISYLIEVRSDVKCYRLTYVPLVAPSTSIDRVKFLAGIADSFIYVVSKVCSGWKLDPLFKLI